MLSVDNLFVMMMIFTAFQVSNNEYQHVLNWGILGAIVMRCVFIFIGSAIISRFDWVLIVFGLFLVYSAVKMFATRNKEEHIDVERQPVVRFLSRYFRVYPRFEGDRFMVYARKEGDNYVLADRRWTAALHPTACHSLGHRIQRSDIRFRQHSRRLFGITRPLCGLLFQHLCHTRLACHVLPAVCHRRQVQVSQDRCMPAVALHRYKVAARASRHHQQPVVTGLHPRSPHREHRAIHRHPAKGDKLSGTDGWQGDGTIKKGTKSFADCRGYCNFAHER